jgi:hypothetical protein
VTTRHSPSAAKRWSPRRCDFAKPEIYEALEAHDAKYSIRLPANDNLRRNITEVADPASATGRASNRCRLFSGQPISINRDKGWLIYQMCRSLVELREGDALKPLVDCSVRWTSCWSTAFQSLHARSSS